MKPTRWGRAALVGALGLFTPVTAARAAEWRLLDARTHHLRSGGPDAPREWEEFAEKAEGAELVHRFDADDHTNDNAGEYTLRLRQRDVKQTWRVRLNGTPLGTLVADENETTAVYAVAKGLVRPRGNELRVTAEGQPGAAPDDVTVGRVELAARPRAEVLAESTLRVSVVDGDTGAALPCRLTIVDEAGALATTGNVSGPELAVRPGVFYARDGRAAVALTEGTYTVYAGRGFEYSLASERVALEAGQALDKTLRIRRVVPTGGYVACDTHVHTLTYSRHGDCTLNERVLTLAGEGVELAVTTEHNLQVDYADAAERLDVRRYFTPSGGTR